MKIQLPNEMGKLLDYNMIGEPLAETRLPLNAVRTIYSAAHVVANPFAEPSVSGIDAIDWQKTMEFRHYLDGMGMGIAEAMDTAQRGMGLDWSAALELIKRTKQELPNALVANGVGTDHLNFDEVRNLDDVQAAYMQQVDAVQAVGGRIILMASRGLAKIAKTPDDYYNIYKKILSACDEPVILHWLGEMFDPHLKGYWGTSNYEQAVETVISIIGDNEDKIDGIKISLLDAEKEIYLRRKLPKSVKMYTGDDFNYPELMAGDDQGFSHALLGIFDPIAPAAALAVSKLTKGDVSAFRDILDPTVPLARHIFKSPTQYYKTGVVFLAWLNGFQDHFIMLNGAQAMRSLPYFIDCFKMADICGLLRKPDLAAARMQSLLITYGV